MKLFIIIFCSILLFTCGNNKPHDGKTELMAHLIKAQNERIAEGITYTDENGWITPTDCDGFLWSSKFGAALYLFQTITNPIIELIKLFNPRASEYENQPGRYNRSPSMCREGNERSRSTWSRDMGLGLLQYGYLRGDREILERHISYVRGNGWVSGEPRSYDTTVYTPALWSLYYQVIYTLGGEHDNWRDWLSVYPSYLLNPSGLDDFRAHLQMLNIWLYGETIGSIDDVRLARVIEHADREPDNAFYQVMRGRWLGDWNRAIELCKYPNRTHASYIRCDDPRACYIAEEAWSCGLLLRYVSESNLKLALYAR